MNSRAQASLEAMLSIAAYTGFIALMAFACSQIFSSSSAFSGQLSSSAACFACTAVLDSFASNSASFLELSKSCAIHKTSSFKPLLEQSFSFTSGGRVLEVPVLNHYRWFE